MCMGLSIEKRMCIYIYIYTHTVYVCIYIYILVYIHMYRGSCSFNCFTYYIYICICIHTYLKICKYVWYKHMWLADVTTSQSSPFTWATSRHGQKRSFPIYHVCATSHCHRLATPGLVGHQVALLWRCVTLRVRRDDKAGRQSLAGREPLALGVIQATLAGWLSPHSACWVHLTIITATWATEDTMMNYIGRITLAVLKYSQS